LYGKLNNSDKKESEMHGATRLQKYEEIVSGKAHPRYLLTKSKKCAFEPQDGSESLWKLHDRLIADSNVTVMTDGARNLLELKAFLVERMLYECNLCERRCGANRKEGEKGQCGVLEARVSSDFIHMGEEPEVIPSYTIFFSGCTFRCVFCQNWDISTHPEAGRRIEPEDMANMIESRDPHLSVQSERIRMLDEGIPFRRSPWGNNVNWVGGDPTSNLHFILETLTKCKTRLPQIWNSNMYLTVESMKLLEGVIDLFLTDFKYGNDQCAKRLSGIEHYFEIISRNHLLAARQCDIIVRHLVLPNHIECCTRPVLEWIADHIPEAVVNVMEQYRPEHRAHKFEDISRCVSSVEFNEALRIADTLGLKLTR